LLSTHIVSSVVLTEEYLSCRHSLLLVGNPQLLSATLGSLPVGCSFVLNDDVVPLIMKLLIAATLSYSFT